MIVIKFYRLVTGELFAATTASYPYTNMNVTSEDENHKEPLPVITVDPTQDYTDEEYSDEKVE
jgi:hypothetical protein